MLITNKSRKKQIDIFVDKDHSVMGEFYEICEQGFSINKLLKEMYRLLEIDEEFCDPYLTIAEILFYKGKNQEADEILRTAYERAVVTIADSKGRWPKEMPWGYLENRHLMRAIEEYGMHCWKEEKIDEALEIFHRLLRCNPNDNQGMRFNILAIRLGLDMDEWEKPFEMLVNKEIVGLDALKMHEWFKENALKFPDDFHWLISLHERNES